MVPSGFCQCGCGQRTTMARQSSTRLGYVKGQPVAYASGHNSKSRRPATGPMFCACGCGASVPIAKYASHQRRYVHGHNPSATHVQTAIERRFWDRVDKNGPVPPHRPDLGACWVFTGSDKGPWGHARMHVRNKRTLAHRLSWELAHGPIAPGLAVLHHCDNGACVRPDHLFLGSQADNMRDMVQKQRHASQLRRRTVAA